MSSSQSSRQSSVESRKNNEGLPSTDELYEMGNKLSFKLTFVDLQQVVCDALQSSFPSKALSSEIRIVRGRFEDYLVTNEVDCIVSSSNAFGLMDHGFDRSICKLLSDQTEKIKTRIQHKIIERYDGEQPVGTCIIVETQNEKIKYLAHSPTRRINYSIKATDNIYMSIKAIINEIKRWNASFDYLENSDDLKIRNVLLTGLGTFYGAVSAQESARQTVLGWLLGRLPKPKVVDIDWNYAKMRQSLIGYGGFNDVVRYIHENKESLTKSQQTKLAHSLSKDVIEEVCKHDNRDNVEQHQEKNKDCLIM